MRQRSKPNRSPAPKATRPYMPGYGLEQVSGTKGLLPWSWGTARLRKARRYWLATVQPDGSPHAMPVWGVWLGDAFYFSTGEHSRKARNVAGNSRCVVGAEPASQTVILEGHAQRVTNRVLLKQFARTYQAKYRWDMSDFSEPVYSVRPRVAFGFMEDPRKFSESATRWLFRKG